MFMLLGRSMECTQNEVSRKEQKQVTNLQKVENIQIMSRMQIVERAVIECYWIRSIVCGSAQMIWRDSLMLKAPLSHLDNFT